MKADVLTLAALIFVVGLLFSSFSVSDIFAVDEQEQQSSSQRSASLN